VHLGVRIPIDDLREWPVNGFHGILAVYLLEWFFALNYYSISLCRPWPVDNSLNR
jgi:hypothetical protein